ncbi:MAG: Na/Pi symporter [Pseudomonadota bacterium]|nr:Na/Pi symporter [Pseudomonadota bacterium]
MELAVISSVLGGVGLFLLGMYLMTNGLQLAAGEALKSILETSTRTTLRGVLAGITITSIVQSSSAVTLATIGFVNAGLIKLRQAITVIYGSNIGTTTTAWLVALVGFHLDIKVFALPAIGIGMAMRLLWRDKRYGALGEALTGFGVFFLGIDILKGGFEGMGSTIQFADLSPTGLGLLLLVGSGFIITFVMQSSSAAMAIILTAAGGGVILLPAAAAMVIGANIGTTTTALISVIGATPNAKRAAAAHVTFNLITGGIALLILPVMLGLASIIQADMGLETDAPALLALFHTLFNVLGVLLLWPFTNQLATFLERRFRSAEEDEAKPRYLDNTLIATPTLAFHALGQELDRIAAIDRRMAKAALSAEMGPGLRLGPDHYALERLVIAAAEFSTAMQKSKLLSGLAEALPNGVRVSRYYTTMAQLAETIAAQSQHQHKISYAPLTEEINHFKHSVVQLLEMVDPALENYSSESCTTAITEIESHYQQLKATLLRDGTAEKISIKEMVMQLELMSHIRRLAEQAEKGARYLHSFKEYLPAEALEESESNSKESVN